MGSIAASVHRETPRWHQRATARTRIVAAQLALVSLAVFLIVAITWVVLTIRDNERIDANLSATGQAFAKEATTIVDPESGLPFDSASLLLSAALDRAVPGPDEVRFSVVDGQVERRSLRGNSTKLYADPALLVAASAAKEPIIGTAETRFGTVRFLAIPVSDSSDSQYHFVAAVERARASNEALMMTLTVGVVGLIGILLTTILSWLTAGRVLAPLRQLRERASQISQDDLTQRVKVEGSDDIAELGKSFNAMVDRLESAFAAQKRFAADAGHELRTPLTILRGNMELLSDDPTMRAEQRAVILDEIDRMTGIIEDLLQLTRAGQRQPPVLEPLTASELLNQWPILVTHLAERQWTWVEGISNHPTDNIFSSDRHRLTQVMLQLAQNAINATTTGDNVEVGIVFDREVLTLWVADSGPGIPRADRDRIFEPFARLAGRRRAESGTGLGLSIVAEIAHGYGGKAYVSAGRPFPDTSLRSLRAPDRLTAPLTGACVVFQVPAQPSSLPLPSGKELDL